MKKNYCLQLDKNQISDFIESIDKKYDILTKELNIKNQAAVEVLCKGKNKYKTYLLTDTSAWYGEESKEYSRTFLTPKWIEYLENIFGEEYTESLSEKIKTESINNHYSRENEELNSL